MALWSSIEPENREGGRAGLVAGYILDQHQVAGRFFRGVQPSLNNSTCFNMDTHNCALWQSEGHPARAKLIEASVSHSNRRG